MATIGLDRLYFAPITENANGDEVYGQPQVLAKAMTAELEIEISEATLYADDGPAESVKEFGTGTLTLGIDDIGVSAAENLTGASIDQNHVVIAQSENGGQPVAIGFRAKKSNGMYRYYWFYKVKFGIPGASLTTKGDEITFSTPSIEGTVLRRNKLDDAGKHPWKAEVNEDDAQVPASVISGWYSQVYEPTFALTITLTLTAQPQDANVTEGAITESLFVTAAATGTVPSYQWYSNLTDSNMGGTAVAGATNASMPIPSDLVSGAYYYYCVVTAGTETVTSDTCTVTVAAG